MTFSEHLKSYLSDEEINSLNKSLEGKNFNAVLLNTRKMSVEKFLSLYPNVNPHPIVHNAFIFNKEEYDLGKSIYHDLGCFYIQEPSAMCVAYLLNANKNDLVLDLCAAPGGKSIQTSFLMNNESTIIANDLSHQRASAILQNVERLGIGNVAITNNDFSLIYQHYYNYFSKIILDTPCSGSGMFRKQKEMLNDWSYAKVKKYAEIQKNLIKMAYFMLKPGGTLSYSTCSFSMEEDEDVIEYLLNNTDAQLIDIDDNTLFYKRRNNPIGIHLFPNLFPGEGHYICLIKKPGNLSENGFEKSKNIHLNKKYNLPEDKIVEKFGNYLFLNNNCFLEKGLSFIRKGVKVGEIVNDIIKFDHHYSTYISSFENELEIDLQNALDYIKGNSLNIPRKKGYVLLKYDGINLDIAKSDGRIIKNKYPKYLRK